MIHAGGICGQVDRLTVRHVQPEPKKLEQGGRIVRKRWVRMAGGSTPPGPVQDPECFDIHELDFALDSAGFTVASQWKKKGRQQTASQGDVRGYLSSSIHSTIVATNAQASADRRGHFCA